MNSQYQEPQFSQPQQDQLSPSETYIQPSSMMDSWLTDSFSQSGLFSQDLIHLLQQQLLPDSPPISPPETKQQPSSVSPAVPLFPDIHPTSTPTPIVTHKLPRLAPRPSTQLLTPVTPVISSPAPPTPIISNKRKAAPLEDEDEIALKRQKNTDAARRSRLKKLMKMESLEKRVSELESDNNQLNTRIAVLESEKSGLTSKDQSLQERIRVLEAQLAEAHRALTSR
ncbi:G-box-binding factor 1 [Choanephora cucurbitarum]|uniref:G-box-binding factor 1 n=1 Tax=Choanephora cucurbitarum TaxID=101091 RepID=A0A1C7NNU9_9FUNG|nr:G-box-binding factor 1 [Choanephora cucurbitarum]